MSAISHLNIPGLEKASKDAKKEKVLEARVDMKEMQQKEMQKNIKVSEGKLGEE